jgi:pyruvate/2-oxoglutarate dehydrogenase complex dihydrolipoamide dehydrogenase (E3) component/ketosteroid isomerase-like protein
MHDTDVIVVGSGQAGTPLATRLVEAGRSVVLFERGDLGGTCTNSGCTPTKTMIASARAAHVARTAGRLGVRVGSVTVDFAAVVARKDAIVERWRRGVQNKLARAGDRLLVVREHARFAGERTLEAGGEQYRAPVVVLDVGARAAVPPLKGLSDVPWLDNHTALDLRQLPRHLLVLGGGYIGCEMGQMFRRFGAAVTVVHTGEHILSREDPDVVAPLEEALRSEGVELRLRATAEGVRKDGDDVVVTLSDGSSLRGSHLLLALGRRPNTDDLRCEAGGVRLDARGCVVADDFYATSAAGIYAVGDVLGGPQFTHTSWDDHRLLFDLLMRPDAPRRPRSARIVPYTVFTDPQLASVGLNERTARARGVPFEIATMPFGEIARAIEIDETAGTMKVLLDPASERFLGVSLVGAEAGELLHPFVVLMQAGAPARAMVDAEMVHPTFSEGLQTLVMRLPRYSLARPLGEPSPADGDVRTALDRHWAASNEGNEEAEGAIYHDDVVLEYPQSGERFQGRRNVLGSRTENPTRRRFEVHRTLGAGDLWVVEYAIIYDGRPVPAVSVLEFRDGKVAREIQYFADRFDAPAWRAKWRVEPRA